MSNEVVDTHSSISLSISFTPRKYFLFWNIVSMPHKNSCICSSCLIWILFSTVIVCFWNFTRKSEDHGCYTPSMMKFVVCVCGGGGGGVYCFHSAGFYTKGRPLVKSNLICPSDKFSWQPCCPVFNINIQGNFCISQGNASSDNLPENLV